MKRFRDTGIWDKPWFRKLDAAQKCAWTYLTDRCDNVGVFPPDKELAEFQIGTKVDWDGLLQGCNGNIEILENGKWWLVDFCSFQHGDLFARKESAVTKSYLSLLDKHGLTQRVGQVFANSCQTVKGEGKGKGKGIGGESEGGDPVFNFKIQKWENITEKMLSLWEQAYPACDMEKELTKMAVWLIANPAKKKSNYKRFIANWLSRAQDRGGTK